MRKKEIIIKRTKLLFVITFSSLVLIFIGWQLNSYSQKIRNFKPNSTDDSSSTLYTSDIIGIKSSSSSWGTTNSLTLNFTNQSIQKQTEHSRGRNKDREGVFKGEITRTQKEKLKKVLEKEAILQLKSMYLPKKSPMDSADWSVVISFSNGWKKEISGYHAVPNELRVLLRELDNIENEVHFSNADSYHPIEEQPTILNEY